MPVTHHLRSLLPALGLAVCLWGSQVLLVNADEAPHPLDTALDQCLAKDSSSMGTHACLDQFEPRWDAVLNSYYARLGGDKHTELRQAQLAWIRYRDAKSKWINQKFETIYERNGGGTMYSIMAHSETFEIVRKRALELIQDHDQLSGKVF